MTAAVNGSASRNPMKAYLAFLIFDSVFVSLRFVIIGPYLKALGFTPLEYGLIGSVSAAATVIATLAVGWITDLIGPKKLIYLALIIDAFSIASLLPGLTVLIYASSVLSGLANSIIWVPLEVIVSQLSKEEAYHYSYSYTTAVSEAGRAIGGFAGWLPELATKAFTISTLTAYKATLIMCLAAIPISMMLFHRVEVPKPNAARITISRDTLKIPKNLMKFILKIAAFNLIIGFGASISVHNIAYYFILKYGVGSGELGTLWGLEALAMALILTGLPKLSERLGGSLKTFLLISSTSIPLMIAVTLVNDYYLAMTLFMIRTVLMNVVNPLFTAFIMRHITPTHRGKARSLTNIAWTIATIPGSGFGGYLLGLDLELPLRLTASIYAAGLTYLALTFREDIKEGK